MFECCFIVFEHFNYTKVERIICSDCTVEVECPKTIASLHLFPPTDSSLILSCNALIAIILIIAYIILYTVSLNNQVQFSLQFSTFTYTNNRYHWFCLQRIIKRLILSIISAYSLWQWILTRYRQLFSSADWKGCIQMLPCRYYILLPCIEVYSCRKKKLLNLCKNLRTSVTTGSPSAKVTTVQATQAIADPQPSPSWLYKVAKWVSRQQSRLRQNQQLCDLNFHTLVSR